MSSALSSLSDLFKVLCDETRIRILALLENNELAVNELQKILQIGQSTLSSQLSQLREHNLVKSRKEGQRVYYSSPEKRENSEETNILNSAINKYLNSEDFQTDSNYLDKVLQERSETSKSFFNSLKDKELHPPGQGWEAISLGFLKLLPARRIVDFGCGSGEVSHLIFKMGRDVIGVDISEERIKAAKAKLTPGLESEAKLQFLQENIEQTSIPSNWADMVIISQSLHHTANPRNVLKEAYRIMTRDANIIILDLTSHQLEWMRNEFGDFWLGFSMSDINEWMEKCGFRCIQSQSLSLDTPGNEASILLISAKK
jgi:2-polyprenyl-3-methyl-5-hydroxy-6-metoxy-1,4-benzoquinol methylase